MLPNYPTELFTRPFADNGTYQIIPDTTQNSGRASLRDGFPVETQLPLSNGGVAPNRTDFNGIFHMLSSMAFWQQSGGQWVYNAGLDYNTPSFVYHKGGLWWCKSPNGPSTLNGAVVPGTNENVWIDLYTMLRENTGKGDDGYDPSTGVVSVKGYPGEFRNFFERVPPQGWRERNGAVLYNANNLYPELWAALTSSAFSWKCVTQAQWNALSSASSGVGGVPYFVVNTLDKSIKLPDTRGDYERSSGSAFLLNVGDWHNSQNLYHSHAVSVLTTTAATMWGAPTTFGPAVTTHTVSTTAAGGDEARTRTFATMGCVYVGG